MSKPFNPDGIEATVDGRLEEISDVRWDPRPAVCVVMASEGYPGSYPKGRRITGLDAVGDALVFHGGVDNQQTLAFGSVEDVRQEVLDNIRILGEGGGYILAPCHNIQPITPTENILAMYETIHELGL